MPNDPTGANGEALPANRLDALLSDCLDAAVAVRELVKEHRAACAALPDWARPGPQFLFSDGTKGGPVVGWPEVADLPAAAPGAEARTHRCVRPSIEETWHRHSLRMFPGGRPDLAEARRRQRRAAFAAVREVIARIRQQQEERRRVGLDEIGRRLDEATRRFSRLEVALRRAAAHTPARELAQASGRTCRIASSAIEEAI